MYKRIAVAMMLLLLTVAVARAEEPNTIQRAVIHVNRIAKEVKQDLFDRDRQTFFDTFMPVDDFRLYVKPNLKKSIKKGKLHYTVGFRFTF